MNNKKSLIYIAMLLFIALIAQIIYLNCKLKTADNYINALEKDYPEYIDTTAEGDEYYMYYNEW